MLTSFTVRWSPERLEETTIDGIKAMRVVSDFEVEDSEGKLIMLPDGHIHGKIAIEDGPNRKERIEHTMMACAKNVEKILTEKGLFSPAPTQKTLGLDVKEG